MPNTRPEPILYANDARGIYIPQHFGQTIAFRALSGVSSEDYDTICKGPDEEHYWEAWDSILSNAVVTDEGGQRFTLHQEGDLWLIPEGMEWDEDSDFYIWPEDGEPEHDGQPDEAQEWHDFNPDC